MQGLVLKNRAGHPITQREDWPRREKQWKPGRSAMEIARAWFTSGSPQCPPELRLLLTTQASLADIVFRVGRPEHITALPLGNGGTNHDLALNGRAPERTTDDTPGMRTRPREAIIGATTVPPPSPSPQVTPTRDKVGAAPGRATEGTPGGVRADGTI